LRSPKLGEGTTSATTQESARNTPLTMQRL
jgi:hypothetical protein